MSVILCSEKLKRSLWASFFSLLYLINIEGYVAAAPISWDFISSDNQSQFMSLLHYSRQGEYKIKDPDFLLGPDDSTIKELFKKNHKKYKDSLYLKSDYICNFPARAIWFYRQEGHSDSLNFTRCPELSRYINSVSENKVKLIYASENLLSPSSFMGHVFLRFSKSDNDSGQAVSFMTDINGFNIPKIMYESLVSGKEGYLIVNPYQESNKYYTVKEGRNLYEYELKLNKYQRLLLKLHLWELRNKKIEYHFQSYNCATFVLDMLSLVDPTFKIHESEWLSPLDIVKYTFENNIIKKSSISPSLEWKLRSYSYFLNKKNKNIFSMKL